MIFISPIGNSHELVEEPLVPGFVEYLGYVQKYVSLVFVPVETGDDLFDHFQHLVRCAVMFSEISEIFRYE
jgi:hypothetical protein